MDSNDTPVNDGYIHPMVCCSCLKVWVDNEPIRNVKYGYKEDTIEMFGQEVPVRECPRCVHDAGRDWPGTSRLPDYSVHDNS